MKTYTYKIDRYEFTVNCTEEKNGKFTCHIPAYDIIFGASDEEMIERKATAMVSMWFNYFGIK